MESNASEHLELKDIQHASNDSIADRRKNKNEIDKSGRRNTGLPHSSNIYQVRK